MTHSNTGCCRAVINGRSLRLDLQLSFWTGISRDMNFSHWQFPIHTKCMETYVNVFRWDVLFVLHKLQTRFLFKCFKFSLCWRSLYLSLLFDKDISRGMRAFGRLRRLVKGNWGQWQATFNRQLLKPVMFHDMVNEGGMEPGLSTSHLNHLLYTEN